MAVVAVVSVVAKQLGNLLGEEAKYLWGVEKQVKNLESELSWVGSFLEEAEEANQMEDKLVRQRVLEIRDIAYDIQDVVEEFTLRIASKRNTGCIKRCIGFPREMKRLHHIRSEMNKISETLTELKRRSETYGTHKPAKPRLHKGETSSSFNRSQLRRSYAHVHEDNLVGIDKELKALVPLLTDDHFKVVCIHGMGGLGKTTLAKVIYHDPQVRCHFDHFAWVYISPQFSTEEKWEDALNDLGVLGSAPNLFFKAQRNSQELAKRLHDFLKANKCLLVLDDVWNTGDLDALMPGFPMEDNNNNNSNSKILITSRNQLDVAQHSDRRGYLHQLQSLDEDQSWDLLQKIVFRTGYHDKGSMNNEMVEVGRKISKRCQGLPLALKAIGGILATKGCTYNEWKTAHDHVESYLRKEKKWSVQDALALSYDYLPPHLKPCFLYLSHFPEGFHIDVEKLIHMWVAEGFLSVEEEEEITTMEDIAEGYFEELIKRGMIQLGEFEDCTELEIKKCYMHDYVRELCLSKAREENFICIADISSKDRERGITPSVAAMIGKTRRLAIHETVRVESIKSPSLRTMLFFKEINSDLPEDYPRGSIEEKALRNFSTMDDKSCFWKLTLGLFFISTIYNILTMSIKHVSSKFKKLRVLDFERSRIGLFHLPSIIGNLIHLRYLSLADVVSICKLPSSLGKLICLQTLDLRVETVDLFMDHILFNIPDVIWRMEQLRHLYLPDEYCQFPKLRLDTLKNLQTLVNLQVDDSSTAQLGHLTNLRTLTICGSSASDMHDAKYFPCCCCCPLKEEKYMGLKEDAMVTLGSLPNLRRLAIKASGFIGERMVFSSTSFPKLEFLILSHLPELNMLRVDEGALPKLHYLSINWCKQLKELPEGFRSVTTLQKVDIEYMPENFKNWWNINDQAAHASKVPIL